MGALDSISVTPTYRFKVPSTGKEVKFKPYIVRTEKALQLAKESDDPQIYITAVQDLISDCVYGELDVEAMPTFDVEMFFLRLRAVSVDDQIEREIICKNMVDDRPCHQKIPVMIDINSIKVDIDDIKKNRLINLTDDVSIEMKFPTFDTLRLLASNHDIIDIISSMIESIVAGSNVFLVNDLTRDEVVEFIEKLTVTQFNLLVEFLRNVPTIKYNISVKCPKCGHLHEYTFSGIYDFFG